MWLGIENEDDLYVPLPEETLIRFKTFELDPGDLARRLAKMWQRLEFVADIAISNGVGMVDPVTELVPLCSNCHSMVHRRNPPVHPVDLRAQLGRPPKPSELVGSTGPKSEI